MSTLQFGSSQLFVVSFQPWSRYLLIVPRNERALINNVINFTAVNQLVMDFNAIVFPAPKHSNQVLAGIANKLIWVPVYLDGTLILIFRSRD